MEATNLCSAQQRSHRQVLILVILQLCNRLHWGLTAALDQSLAFRKTSNLGQLVLDAGQPKYVVAKGESSIASLAKRYVAFC